MKKLGTIVAIGVGLAFVGGSAHAQLGIPAKLKAGKVQGNLVPAYAPPSGSGTGGEEGDHPALQQVATLRSNMAPDTRNCMFTQGKFKAQVGKDATVQLKGVVCGAMATPYTGNLCAHTKALSTIMNEDIDKNGAPTAKTCTSGTNHLEGNTNFSTAQIGSLTCSAGTCKGTLSTVTADPCPGVDKVSELRRLEVFDGPDFGTVNVLGTDLKVCCGPRQTAVGNINTTGFSPCDTSTQDVLGEIGTVTQGVAP